MGRHYMPNQPVYKYLSLIPSTREDPGYEATFYCSKNMGTYQIDFMFDGFLRLET